ncbi:CGNR zinc finger domain-containing protein [Actinoplanes sp. HUAS TT8]|uniref:CGNR zinc finger domain-containing protein n=1 Tax=Actinoplanes sp. HUAS TT8 TaxID=3447453 RepID=UPI003F52772C
MRIVGGHHALDLANTVEPRLPGHVETDHLDSPVALLRWATRAGIVTDAEASLVSRAWIASPGTAEAALADTLTLRALIDPTLAGTELDTLIQRWSQAIARAKLIPTPNPKPSPALPPADPPGAVSPGAVSPGTDSPDLVSPGLVSPGLVSSDLVSPGSVSPGLASPGRASAGPAAGGTAELQVGADPAWMIPDRLADALVDLVRTADRRRLRTCPLDQGGCGWLFLDRSRNATRRWCAMEDCGTHAKSRRLTERRRARRP